MKSGRRIEYRLSGCRFLIDLNMQKNADKIDFPSNANIHFQIERSALSRPLQRIIIWYGDFDANLNYISVVIQIVMKKFSIKSNKAFIPFKSHKMIDAPTVLCVNTSLLHLHFMARFFLFRETKLIIKKKSPLFVGLVHRCEQCESSKWSSIRSIVSVKNLYYKWSKI